MIQQYIVGNNNGKLLRAPVKTVLLTNVKTVAGGYWNCLHYYADRQLPETKHTDAQLPRPQCGLSDVVGHVVAATLPNFASSVLGP